MNPDTDGDAVWDGVEVVNYERFDCGFRTYRNDLAGWDCDGDGVRDALDTDSDNDLLPDGWIDGANGKPLNAAQDAGEFEDRDFNGLIAGDANGNRIMDAGELWTETDPLNRDSDGDGVQDGIEVLSPLGCFIAFNPDTDTDGLLDGQEDRNANGVIDGDTGIPGLFGTANDGIIQANETWLDTNPCNPDSDLDGVRDYIEVWGWEQGNLITDGWSTINAPQPKADPDGDGKIDAVDPDSDGDFLCDSWGAQNNPNPGWQQSGPGVFPVGWTEDLHRLVRTTATA